MDSELKDIAQKRARKEQDYLGREIDRYDELGGGQAYGQLGLRNQETAATLGDVDLLGGTNLMSSTNLPRKLRNIDREYEISSKNLKSMGVHKQFSTNIEKPTKVTLQEVDTKTKKDQQLKPKTSLLFKTPAKIQFSKKANTDFQETNKKIKNLTQIRCLDIAKEPYRKSCFKKSLSIIIIDPKNRIRFREVGLNRKLGNFKRPVKKLQFTLMKEFWGKCRDINNRMKF